MSSSNSNHRTTADLAYDAIYSGAIGGAAVAMLILLVDTINGHPLFTPSLMGSLLFSSASATAVTAVNLDMVAYATLIHFAAFGLLGAGTAGFLHVVEQRSPRPGLLLAGLFTAIAAAFFVVAAVAMPGFVSRVGVLWIGVAHFVAAGAITLFLDMSRDSVLLGRLKSAVHLG